MARLGHRAADHVRGRESRPPPTAKAKRAAPAVVTPGLRRSPVPVPRRPLPQPWRHREVVRRPPRAGGRDITPHADERGG